MVGVLCIWWFGGFTAFVLFVLEIRFWRVLLHGALHLLDLNEFVFYLGVVLAGLL